MADHTGHLGVHQLLCHGRTLFGIGTIVFCHQLELDLLAVDGHTRGVELVNRHTGAQLVVLAQMGNGAADRADVADLDHRLRRRCRRGSRRSGLLLLSAGAERSRGSHQGQGRCNLFDVHEASIY